VTFDDRALDWPVVLRFAVEEVLALVLPPDVFLASPAVVPVDLDEERFEVLEVEVRPDALALVFVAGADGFPTASRAFVRDLEVVFCLSEERARLSVAFFRVDFVVFLLATLARLGDRP
jgi:hypothetical protein